MSNRFDRPARHAHIRGVEISSTPVPWRLVRAGIEAEAAGDHAALLGVMAQVVRECVTFADGSPLDPDEIDCATIAELFAFASGRGDGANFTPPASSASPAAAVADHPPAQTAPPPT